MKLDTNKTFPQFLKKELGLASIPKKEYGLNKRHYPCSALFSNDPSQTYYKNDKFLLGVELSENEFMYTLRLHTLLLNEASWEEIILLIRAIVDFCDKKGISMLKGRPKGESKNVTVSSQLYK